MDASNEAPFGVGLDEFIEFTKRGKFFFSLPLFLSLFLFFTQTKVRLEGATA